MIRILPILLFLIGSWSCGAVRVPVAIHPGAVNTFDSNSYDILLAEQAAINAAKLQIGNYPNLKPILNRVIDEYETTMKAYKLYHTSATLGNVADPTLLQREILDLVQSVTSLTKGLTIK